MHDFGEEEQHRGQAQGRLEATREILERLLSRRFDLTDAERRRIRFQKDPKVLEAAMEVFMSAGSKQSVIGHLSRLRNAPRIFG